ncbi:TAP-like protein-domain-containing protein [Immersiella caudata]|uniref:TAP-like protein-domain-containing protein n=1 Tax=Immersiella caudata TaxID=314043 RepID=A0AA39XIE4_9PEZI|nr:TAP-like protein-domain-containing protein [Immersiella caudata]
MRSSPSLISIFSLFFVAQACSSAKIEWGPCKDGEFNTTLTVQCGTLNVPLDYTSQVSNESLDLEVVKLLAPVQPSQGSIQLNFGGPGVPTRELVVAVGPILQILSGGAYDLIGFDPRGTGKTLPFICTDNDFIKGQMLSEGLRSTLESDTMERRVWERARLDANICRSRGNGNKTGELAGTAFVARDIMSVAEATGEDGLLRYWGFSYGTTLGATLVAMFPDKVDKVILDGVQNAHEYYHAHADYEEWTDSDPIFSYFFESCLTAPPGRCALAALNKTASELERDAWTFIESVRAAPIPAGTTLIDAATFKGYILGQLKYTGGWPAFSSVLATLLYGSRGEAVRVLEAIVEEAEANGELGIDGFDIQTSLWAIHCGDRTVRLDSWEAQEADGVFKRLYNTSRLVGDIVAPISASCAQWPWRAKETYKGDFQVATRKPVLVASNTRDSHTPLRSAKNLTAGFEGSGLLEVNATGHATLNAPSVCGYLATVGYWLNGTLPEKGSVCEAPHPYAEYGWDNVLEEVTGSPALVVEKRALNRRGWF